MPVPEHSAFSGDRAFGTPWFAEWFDHPLYLQVYSHRDSPEAARCIATILARTQPSGTQPASVRVLDIACGAGRHAIELARLGYAVTGNDLSPFLLETARQQAIGCEVALDLTCRDMRALDENGGYHLVLQLFTSFGYFEQDDDDRRVLGNVYRALEPGGWYVLDLINPVFLKRHLVGVSERRMEGLSVLEERALDGPVIRKRITITPDEGAPMVFTESVRLFEREEIAGMLEETGFIVESIAGDYSGAPFDSERSPRMMLFSQKR
jgi:SAM-dependent methyltransferase